MPSGRQSVKRQHPNSGVRLDFENLLKSFTETETVRYEQFAEVWRKMKFSMLCAGRQNDREVREFMDECFHIALSYYLPPYNFQVRVGGLYLIYGLYFTQLCFPRSKIRVTLDQWKQILEFQEDAKSQKHLDVDFCFQKLLFKHAFLFVATSKQVYPRSGDTVETVVSSEMPDELKETQGCLQTMFSANVLEELSAVHTQYEKIKISLAGPDAERPARSLDMIQSKLVDSIVSRLESHNEKLTKLKQQLQQKRSLLELSDEEDPTFEPSMSNAAKLKAKAFSGMVKQSRSRRHRSVLMQDSPPENSPSTSVKESTCRMPLGLSDDDEADGDDSDDYDTLVDSLIKMERKRDFLPMPTLTTEKASSTEKSFPKKGLKKSKKQLKEKQSSATTLDKQKKQRGKSATKERKKAGKKGVTSDSDMDNSLTPKKKKRKQDNTPKLPSEDATHTQDNDNKMGLPKIKVKQRKPRKKKSATMLEKSENIGETVVDVNEKEEFEAETDTDLLSPKKKRRIARKVNVKVVSVTDIRTTAGETVSSGDTDGNYQVESDLNMSTTKKISVKEKKKQNDDTDKISRVESDLNMSSTEKISVKQKKKQNDDTDKISQVESDSNESPAKKKALKQKKKQKEVVLIDNENSVEETVSTNDKNIDKNSAFEVGNDTDFSSPKRKRRHPKTKITETVPITIENKADGENETHGNTELPSARKKLKRSGQENKSSAKSGDDKTTRKRKDNKLDKQSTEFCFKANDPKMSPVPVKQKEKSPRKQALESSPKKGKLKK
ncbi:eukaryotic translation initiation factor 5B-like [Gigantopelta aegis]|uniref:eukaryotic translation initiation factor 5B-like n=1 Tax=Gigantopelta aegis TaxID=1735272 RepID=UPI001B88A8DB|nr:eukaryotic translation initiation factor 5B-like [Gigantopelta aegis]